MRLPLRRAIVAATALALLTIPTVSAETLRADGDRAEALVQDEVDLGSARPGQDVAVDVMFVLECSGTGHVDPGQSIRMSPGPRTIPPGGGFSISSFVFAPGAGWPVDGEPCPTGLAAVVAGPTRLVVTAPPALGTDFRYSFTWNRTLQPSTIGDGAVFEGPTATVVFLLDVTDNTPPALVLPDAITLEGDMSGGAVAAYAASATDAEDPVPPTPACAPTVGEVLLLGATTVACSVTDDGGLTTTGSFAITVVDTTRPSLVGVPGGVSLATPDPAGAVLAYTLPTASDIVDANVAVACVPGPGAVAPVGDSSVTCTATDDAGNESSATFPVSVEFDPPIAWSVGWGEPVGGSPASLVANHGRTVPVKVEIFADGVEQLAGEAWLRVEPCAGGEARLVALAWGAGRWDGHLDTSTLRTGCHVATAVHGGDEAGSFRLHVRGDETAARAPLASSRRPR